MVTGAERNDHRSGSVLQIADVVDVVDVVDVGCAPGRDGQQDWGCRRRANRAGLGEERRGHEDRLEPVGDM